MGVVTILVVESWAVMALPVAVVVAGVVLVVVSCVSSGSSFVCLGFGSPITPSPSEWDLSGLTVMFVSEAGIRNGVTVLGGVVEEGFAWWVGVVI